jgi:hypothetical protein
MAVALSARRTWFELVPESDADFLVVVGAHWDDTERCGGVVIPIPGLQLGLESSERGPDWRDLETLEKSAAKLAEDGFVSSTGGFASFTLSGQWSRS